MISFPDCSLRSKVVAGFPVCGLFLCGSAGGGIYLRDEEYMRHALTLASYARGRTSPNPMVGAVLVRDGEIVGQGWHRQAGTPHAEIHALRQAGDLAKAATLYVTLEPCCHQGRTGPCTEAIIQAGVRRVVMAMTDPNPLVAGCGSQRLREAGVEVEEGLLSCEAALLNEVFIKGISTGMPFVVMKAAMTLDGKIASHTGHSRWITGEAARLEVHRLRNEYDAILVGVGTAIADNPQLTTRLPEGGRNPIRIILDSKGRLPLNSKMLCDGEAPTWIAVTQAASQERIAALQERADVMVLPADERGGVDIRALCRYLRQERQLTSVFVEGGSAVHGSFLNAGVVDKVHFFMAPKLIGGCEAPGPIGGQGCSLMDQAVPLEELTVQHIGEDLWISAYVATREGRDVYRTCGRIG